MRSAAAQVYTKAFQAIARIFREARDVDRSYLIWYSRYMLSQIRFLLVAALLATVCSPVYFVWAGGVSAERKAELAAMIPPIFDESISAEELYAIWEPLNFDEKVSFFSLIPERQIITANAFSRRADPTENDVDHRTHTFENAKVFALRLLLVATGLKSPILPDENMHTFEGYSKYTNRIQSQNKQIATDLNPINLTSGAKELFKVLETIYSAETDKIFRIIWNVFKVDRLLAEGTTKPHKPEELREQLKTDSLRTRYSVYAYLISKSSGEHFHDVRSILWTISNSKYSYLQGWIGYDPSFFTRAAKKLIKQRLTPGERVLTRVWNGLSSANQFICEILILD